MTEEGDSANKQTEMSQAPEAALFIFRGHRGTGTVANSGFSVAVKRVDPGMWQMYADGQPFDLIRPSGFESARRLLQYINTVCAGVDTDIDSRNFEEAV